MRSAKNPSALLFTKVYFSNSIPTYYAMKYLLSFCIIFSFHHCKAQNEHLIRIVSFAGDVTLDDLPVTLGQLVFPLSKKLVVAKNASYAYVLTQKGYTMKLGPGSYNIRSIENYVYNKKYKPRLMQTGAVHKSAPCKLLLIGLDNVMPILLMNDSIHIRWKNNPIISNVVTPPYRLEFSSVFDDLLSEVMVSENFIKTDLRRIAGNEVMVILNIIDGGCTSIAFRFLTSEDSSRFSSDLGKVLSDPIQKNILDLVIYDGNNLIVDLMFELDKISKTETTSLPSDLKNYVSLLKKKYEMN